jgi:tetratricopeptide (TPR) repeat protein
MAETGGSLGILLSGADSPVEGSVAEPPTALDPTAAALAAEAAKSNPELAEKASAYFDKQSHLVEVQTEHLHEQRAVNLQLLKLKRLDERLKVGLRVFVILVATVIGIGGVVLIRDAVTSRNVIIESFDLSPDLATRNFSGKIVAAGILDQLERLQATTQGTTQKASLGNAWDRDIKIEVPETGLSISDIARVLRERFGHDIRIDGDLTQTPSQELALTVRGTGLLPRTFNGAATELPRLTSEAAEYLYAQSRPALWATYLASVGRNEEAIAFARKAIRRTEPLDRARVFDVWSDAVAFSGGSLQEAMALAEEAVKLNPKDWGAQNDRQEWLARIGDEEAALRAGDEMKKLAGGRPGQAPEVLYLEWDLLTWNLATAVAAFRADLDTTGGNGTNFGSQLPRLAWMQALLHDPEAARFTMSDTYDEDQPLPAARRHQVNATLADEQGDTAVAGQEWEAVADAYKDKGVANFLGAAICNVAPALERAGRHSEANASLAAVERLTFVDCYRFRGDVLDLRGDWAAAQDWYGRAVKLGPSLPAGYYSWGVALAKHGYFDAAVEEYRDANRRGSHWADPLKAWGDVLAKQGKIKQALAKYDEALRYAPNWRQLKEARERLAKHKS